MGLGSRSATNSTKKERLRIEEPPHLFLGMLVVSLVLVVLLGVGFWFVTAAGTAAAVILVGFAGVIGPGLVLFYYFARRGLHHRWTDRVAGVLVRWIYPLVMFIGSLLGIEKARLRASYVAAHNQVTSAQAIRVQGHEVLVLLPHCLQWSECPHRITHDASNCAECGRCQLPELLALQREYDFAMAVATGGTLARQLVAEHRPKVVIGVACERDLVSGMQDVRGIVVFGVANLRPHGPCRNTQVNPEEIRELLHRIVY